MAVAIISLSPGPSDEVVRIVEWAVEQGAWVEADALVVTIESSKASLELHAETAGTVHQVTPADVTVSVGAVIGWILSEGESIDELSQSDAPVRQRQNVPLDDGMPMITNKARALAERHGIDITSIEAEGVIRTEDVEAAIASAGVGAPVSKDGKEIERIPLDPIQQSVRDAVSKSWRDNAPAFMFAELEVDTVLGMIDEKSKTAMVKVSLLDVLIVAVARLLARHPMLNAQIDGDHLLLHKRINVSTTIARDKHLFLPVLQDADTGSASEIASRRLDLALQIFRGATPTNRAARATFCVSPIDQPVVTHHLPVIPPGQVAILGVGGVRNQFAADDEGKPKQVSIVGLCISYDHRAVNGDYVARFLQDLSSALSAPRQVEEFLRDAP